MKQKMNISVDEKKIRLIEKYINDGVFRNKSYALETGLDTILKDLEVAK